MENLNYNKAELKVLKNNFFMAKALYETIKEEAENIQAVILTNNEFYESEEWTEMMKTRGGDGKRKRILKPSNSFLMDENDSNKYFDLCYEEYKKAGIDDKRGRGWCPEAEAHDLFWEAEKQLVEYAINIIPIEMKEREQLREAVRIVKYKEKVLDLILMLEC